MTHTHVHTCLPSGSACEDPLRPESCPSLFPRVLCKTTQKSEKNEQNSTCRTDKRRGTLVLHESTESRTVTPPTVIIHCRCVCQYTCEHDYHHQQEGMPTALAKIEHRLYARHLPVVILQNDSQSDITRHINLLCGHITTPAIRRSDELTDCAPADSPPLSPLVVVAQTCPSCCLCRAPYTPLFSARLSASMKCARRDQTRKCSGYSCTNAWCVPTAVTFPLSSCPSCGVPNMWSDAVGVHALAQARANTRNEMP